MRQTLRILSSTLLLEVSDEGVRAVVSNERLRNGMDDAMTKIGERMAAYLLRILEIEEADRVREERAQQQRQQEERLRIARAKSEAEEELREQHEAGQAEAEARRLIPQIPELFKICQRQRNALETWKRATQEEARRMARARRPSTAEFNERVERRRQELGEPWSHTLEKKLFS